ncbi:DUF222 domain-containing protein [Pseudonocardia xishanensis]|uniref:YbaB/EbfC DNA-binding family protein n=1 Tax=Pseudonocardia xishanensis TaxID=630995 RepID=A0ABP8RMW5_9PSEU
MTTALAPPTETPVPAAEGEPSHLEDLVALRNRIDAEITESTRAYARAEVAPEKFTARARAARRDRHITISPAGDGMALLRAYLPAEQGIACHAALRNAVTQHRLSPEPVTRTRGQLMTDTLVEHLTSPAPTQPVTAAGDPGPRPLESLVDTA